MNAGREIFELVEYEPYPIAEGRLSVDCAKALHAAFGKQIDIEPPSFLNNYNWRLTSKGWVGYIPLTASHHFSLIPKVQILNLFRMLEYAYRLEFKILDGLADCESIPELYDKLALILAKRVLDRIRRGLYRSYIPDQDDLPFVRGRIDLFSHIQNPSRTSLPCQFEEHTADLEENQILLWTMTRILESGACSERTLPFVRQARRALLSFASLRTFNARICVDRLYNRLNQDYEPIHALCRFFLEQTGPTYRIGEYRMIPILLDMERLFELFVVEWLKQHMPPGYSVRGQENVEFRMGHTVSIRIDITIEDTNAGRTCFVIDTKYKVPDQPSTSDIEQVIAYAEAKNCSNAALIYPKSLSKHIKGMWGSEIHVESFTFPLDGDLDEGGKQVLHHLTQRMDQKSARPIQN